MFIDKVLALVKGQGNQVDIGGAFEKLFSSILVVGDISVELEKATKEQAISAIGISEKDFDSLIAGNFAFVKFGDAILPFGFMLERNDVVQVYYSVYDRFEFMISWFKDKNTYRVLIQEI